MENELSRIVDTLPGLVWTALPDGRTDFVNQRWREYTGLSLEDAAGERWLSAVHPEDLAQLREGWGSALATGAPRELEARLRRSDGAYRWFLFRASPLTDETGTVVKWCGVNTDIEDRRRAEEAVREHDHRFRLVFDGLPALVTMMTPSGGLEHANRHVLEYFGATLEDLQARPDGSTFHPDDWPAVSAAWEASTATGSPYDIEARNRGADGVYRWFHIRGFPLHDPDGTISRWYFLQTDIDGARRAEALLAGERELLEMVAWGSPVLAVLEALCGLLDATAEGCLGSVLLFDNAGARVERAIGPGLPSSYSQALEGVEVTVGAGPCGMAARLKTQVIVSEVASDPRWDHLGWPALARTHGLNACWSSPILSLTGEALGTFAIYRRDRGEPTPFHMELMQKLTHIASIAVERTRGEEALRRSNAYLAEAQHISSTGSMSWRVATDEITWSEQVYRMFEFDPAAPVTLELIGSRVHPEDLPTMQDMIERARGGVGVFEYQHRLLLPDGSVKHLHLLAHRTPDPDGPIEYIGAVQDVTQRRASEEALAKARSELAHVARVSSLGALTASIAHEVNQPLSGIITNASTCLRMLAADPPNVAGALETARRTIRDGNRAADVITRLRALFGKKAAAAEPVDLNEAAREVIALSWSDLQRSRVILRSELAEDLPIVRGDRIPLQQVILNLLLNAADAMSEIQDRPRRLVIRTARDDGDQVRLSVEDSGVGFEPGGGEKLFEAFHTTKSDGMGIGLSVSRSIVEAHNGRLWAAANHGGIGATFSFSIPCEPGTSTSAQGPIAVWASPASPAAAASRRPS